MSKLQESPGGFIGKAKIIAAATVLSRVLGVLREAVFGHVFGASPAWDSFAVAYMIPNLFR
ncbi:unnamed protein product, partial [marine sediment metagenome]